ncbi:MAG: amidohydrolase [Geminicoccaceae bacterium]
MRREPRHRRCWVAGLVGILLSALLSVTADAAEHGLMTVYIAKKIITMEPALPEATAVAIADGRIVSVGTLDSLEPWTRDREVTIDRTFEVKVLMPGFIDPHLHPSLPAVLTQFAFLAPDDWYLPTGEFPGAKTPSEFAARLKQLGDAYFADPDRDPAIPFVAWGYHQLWHGEVYRPQLDELFGDKPVMLWHRSFHELIANTAALELIGLTETEVGDHHEIAWAKGHFWELGAKLLIEKEAMQFLFAPDRYGRGMENFLAMLRQAGVTSAMDMGIGVFGDPVGETALIHQAMDELEAPARLVLTPIITDFLARGVSPDEALKEIETWRAGNSDRVFFDRHFKLMMDGAAFSGLGQFDFPGYLDGHEGVWMAPLETTYEYAEFFWNNGFQLHAHTNGDGSAAALIDIVARLQAQKPRFDHRTVLEHFAYAKEDQLQTLSDLGVAVSANPYYQYILSDIYAQAWLGEDRARNMVPLGAAERAGVRIALHSDSPMAPLSPLTLASAAVNRVTINDNKNFDTQKLSVHQALRAITIDAAWMMRWEDRIGSIRAGKMADFAVLEQDPYAVDPMTLKDIPVWGVVFGGRKYPVDANNGG